VFAPALRQDSEPPKAVMEAVRVLLEREHFTQAEMQLGQLVLSYPMSGECWKLLATATQMRGKDALSMFERAAALLPRDAEAQNNFGNALLMRGRFSEAVQKYEQSLRLDPHYAMAAANLGTAFREMGRLQDAVTAYELAVGLQPGYALAHSNLGIALQELGRLDEAQRSHMRAHECEPDRLSHALHAAMVLPNVAESAESLLDWRGRFEHGLLDLEHANAGVECPEQDVDPSWFYLAYQNRNNRDLNARLCRLLRAKYPTLADGGVVARPAPPEGRRLRIGFVSQFFYSHTIGKLYQGFIAALPRQDFEVLVLHLPGGPDDELRQRINRAADATVRLAWDRESQQTAIRALQLDVLFFPDIGMAAASYFLAYARLAPVQMVSWGHPDTTGIDTIDYYLSCSAIEAVGASEHYTERLLTGSRLPACYTIPTTVAKASRRSFGLPESANLYGCLQSVFKFHPDFDAVLRDIVRLDPSARIVVVEGAKPALVEQLKARWRKSAPELAARVIVLPAQGQAAFLNLMASMDVLLDPLHFGSGNTMYEAMALGMPTVTWPGEFARGRIVAAAYRQMEIASPPIAAILEDYAPIARDRSSRAGALAPRYLGCFQQVV